VGVFSVSFFLPLFVYPSLLHHNCKYKIQIATAFGAAAVKKKKKKKKRKKHSRTCCIVSKRKERVWP
jgi:hypothetical protein